MDTSMIRILSIVSIMALLGTGLVCIVNSDESDAATSYTIEISSGDSSWSGNYASDLISDLCYAYKNEPLLGKNLSSGYIGFGNDEVAYEFYFTVSAGSNTYYPTSITYTSSKMSVVFSLPTSGTYTAYLTYYLIVGGGSITEANMQANKSFSISDPTYTHTVNYSANGGSGSMSSTVVTDSNSGSSYVTLANNGFTKSGYNFTGWKIGTTIYQPGSTVSVSGNSSVTATAQWEKITYTHTIKYSANGGSGSMSNTVVTNTTSGTSYVTLASNSFVKTGYHFTGWKIGSTVYQPGSTIGVSGNSSVTATAQWEANSLSVGSVGTQYAVAGKSVSFTASATSNPSGASVTYSKSDVSSGLTVSISGSTVTCSASSAGTYTFTLSASASGFPSDSTTVTVTFVPALAFTNTPTIGVIGS